MVKSCSTVKYESEPLVVRLALHSTRSTISLLQAKASMTNNARSRNVPQKGHAPAGWGGGYQAFIKAMDRDGQGEQPRQLLPGSTDVVDGIHSPLLPATVSRGCKGAQTRCQIPHNAKLTGQVGRTRHFSRVRPLMNRPHRLCQRLS